jgi:polysaccharide export outer membrane protein
MSLMRAVAKAKGLGEFANSKNVVIFRTSKGQRYVALCNLEAIRRGSYDDPEVFANDLIVVGDSQARRFFKNILPFASTLTYVLVQRL